VPSEQLVATDNETIVGNGSGQAPLSAKAGEISIVVDGVTITGDGTNESPLATIPDHTPVLADGISIVGNGTPSSPLAAVGGPSGAGVSDGVTLQGTGIIASPFAIKAVQHDGTLTGSGSVASHLAVVPSALADLVPVAADGVTIGGNGLTGTPLHVLAGAVVTPFNYTVLGTEPDLANLVIPLPATQPDTGYFVQPWQAEHARFLAMATPDSGKTTTHFVLNLSANATTNDVFNFTVMHP